MADELEVMALVQQYLDRQGIINRAYGLLDDSARVNEAEYIAANVSKEKQVRLDELCSRICNLLEVPMTAVTLIDGKNQIVLGACGMDRDPMGRDQSLCIFVASSGLGFELGDLDVSEQDLVCLPAVRDREIRAYIGRPLVVRNQTIGALCLVDYVPRVWTEKENILLTDYALFVSNILEEK